MLKEKLAGEVKRDKTDSFYLSLALTLRDKLITIEQVREILGKVILGLDFKRLEDIKFTGDATYFKFDNFFVQIRRSGTDAKMRGYSGGENKQDCKEYLSKILHYDGARSSEYEKYIPNKYKGDIYPIVDKLYKKYLYYGM